MNHRINIAFRSNGSVIATAGDHTADSDRALARKMVEAGVADGPVEIGRLGQIDMRAPSLHLFAAGTLSEGDAGFSHGIYAPWPVREINPALERAIAALREARKTVFDNRAARVAAGRAQKPLAVATG